MGNAISFVHTQHPEIELSFSFSSDVCHLTGSPPFSLYAHFRNEGTRSVTLLTFDGPFDDRAFLNQAKYRFFDTKNGKDLPTGLLDICRFFNGPPQPPEPHDLLTLEPQTTHTMSYELARPLSDESRDAAPVPFSHGSTKGLERGSTYSVHFEGCTIDWWAWGSKERVIRKVKTAPRRKYSLRPPGILYKSPQSIVFRAKNEDMPSFRVEE